MKGYYSSSVNSTTGSPKLNLNLRNDSVLPMNSPNESILLRHLRSGLPSDLDFSLSPNKNRPIINYTGKSNSSSSCRSPLTSVENFEDDVLVMDGILDYLRSGLPSVLDYSPSPNKNRPIINYTGKSNSSSSCRSPLTSVENFEDDVLVMDGILIESNKLSKNAGKFRSPVSSESSSSNSAVNPYKTELCMSWENSGTCRYGQKCQFAHGQEEMRPTLNRAHNKARLDFVHPYYSPQSSTYSSGSSKFAQPMATPSPGMATPSPRIATPSPGMATPSPGTATPSPGKESVNPKFIKALPGQAKDASPFKVNNPYYSSQSSSYSSNSSKVAVKPRVTPPPREAADLRFNKAVPIQTKNAPTVSHNMTSMNWSPLDDGIAVKLPSSNGIPSRKAVDEYIHIVLYGPTQKRFPVFDHICPK